MRSKKAQKGSKLYKILKKKGCNSHFILAGVTRNMPCRIDWNGTVPCKAWIGILLINLDSADFIDSNSFVDF